MITQHLGADPGAALESVEASGGQAGVKRLAKRMARRLFRVVDRAPADAGLLLTFDDGPHPDLTPRVLDLLDEHQAKALFFIVGDRIPLAPDLPRKILERGHGVGNHTHSHPLDHVPSLPSYLRDVREGQRSIERATGVRPRWFRPPLGATTLESLLSPSIAGLRSMLWSVDVGDWTLRSDEDAERAGKRLASLASSGDIVLLHDDNPHTVRLLETALPLLRSRCVLNQALGRLSGVG